MQQLVFLLEERSAQEMLKGLLPQFVPESITIRYIIFEGKQDLEKQLVRKLQGWQAPDTAFVVLRDQDSGDCKVIKQDLVVKCFQAGKPDTLVRIACRELESWYLGNLAAVETALGLENLAIHQHNRKYRNPDQLGNATQELKQLTRNTYQKVSGSRQLGPLMLAENTSPSFNAFVTGLRGLIEKSASSST